MAEEHDEWVRNTLGVDPAAYMVAAPSPPGMLRNVEDFAKGAVEGAAAGIGDMVDGLWGAAKAGLQEAHALSTDSRARDEAAAAIEHGASAVVAFAREAVTRPAQATAEVWQAAGSGAALVGQAAEQMAADYEAASKEGHGSEFVGKAIGQSAVLAASFFLPGGAALKVSGTALADAGKAVRLGKVVELLAKSEKAAELGKADQGAAALLSASKIDEAAASIKISPRVGPPHPPRHFSSLRAIPSEYNEASTFETRGVEDTKADSFLKSDNGKAIAQLLGDTKTTRRNQRKLTLMIQSGTDLPITENIAQPLVKIVPAGRGVGAESPFFCMPEQLNAALEKGKNIADFFGLPARSEAEIYDVYMIVPNGAQTVLVNTVAPTAEFDGELTRTGGALQHLVLDRSQWSAPRLIGHITN